MNITPNRLKEINKLFSFIKREADKRDLTVQPSYDAHMGIMHLVVGPHTELFGYAPYSDEMTPMFKDKVKGKLDKLRNAKLKDDRKWLWKRACEQDGIPADSKFVTFGDDNTYAKRLNELPVSY